MPGDKRKYAVILADPPWEYHVYSKNGKGRSAESHYPTMWLADIKALPVADIAEKDCALFLWATFPQLEDALAVIRAWGTGHAPMWNCVSLQPGELQGGPVPGCIR